MKRLAALISALIFSATAQADTMLIVDGSNSMLGEIDNVSKIQIAKDAVNVLLDEWKPSEPLGMVAYGHRQTRSCSDVEVLAPPGSTFGKIRRAVESLSPQGRTPLTEALLTASRTLITQQAQNPTLILLTDGIDTCQKDPCDVASQLKSHRADFRVHVIGFNMTPKAQESISCLSEKTDGRFFEAQNRESLSRAMMEIGRLVASPSTKNQPEPLPVPEVSEQLRALLAPSEQELAIPEPPAKPSNNPLDGITRSDPVRILQERTREIVSRSLSARESATPANPNTTVFAIGRSKVSFSTRLASDDSKIFAFDQPTWTIYDRKGQARGRRLVESNASLPAFELPVGDYFIVLEAETSSTTTVFPSPILSPKPMF